MFTGSPRVGRDQVPLEEFVELVQVDVTEDGRYHAALRNSAERVMEFPVFEVPGFEHVTDKPEKPLVTDPLREDSEKNLVINAGKAIGDVGLDEPHGSRPGLADVPQCGMTPKALPEPVREAGEDRLVNRPPEPAHPITHQFIRP